MKITYEDGTNRVSELRYQVPESSPPMFMEDYATVDYDTGGNVDRVKACV